jgi:hypothetical protein
MPKGEETPMGPFADGARTPPSLIPLACPEYPASVYGSCSSSWEYAVGFLQIPSRDGHLCLWLVAGALSPHSGLSPPGWVPLPGVQKKGR